MEIDGIIVMLDAAAQIGASATIDKESVPILLNALEPVIKSRAEYWQGLNIRCTLPNEEKAKTAEPKHYVTCADCKHLVNSSDAGFVYCIKRDCNFDRHITAVDCVYAEKREE